MGRIGPRRQWATLTGPPQVESQHRKTGSLQRQAHAPKALAIGMATKTMQQQDQSQGIRAAVMQRQQLTAISHGNEHWFTEINRQSWWLQGVAQGLKIPA